MRNQEAARYARWAAVAACSIALVVTAFYAERAMRGYLLRRHGPAPVPMSVEQQSADFSYSDVEAGRTIFTIRASHATQFKDQDLAQLQDVWVTLYGKQGDRNDNIHTRECSYQPKAGTVVCAGEVDIDIQSANPGGAGPSATDSTRGLTQSLHVTTSKLTFNRETGEASTPAPVQLSFAGGSGHGDGLQYDSRDALVRVDHGVALEMAASDRTGGLPVSAAAANLEFHRDERLIALGGPVDIREGDRTLNAERVLVGLDNGYRAQKISAEGHPKITGEENGARFAVAADKFEGMLAPSGVVQHVSADGNVNGSRKSAASDDHFTAGHVEFAMMPEGNELRDMTATGDVIAESRAAVALGGAALRTLRTTALRVSFAAPSASAPGGSVTKNGGTAAERQRVESAETLGPATIESKATDGTVELKAAKFVAEFGADGRLARLLGHSGVQIARTAATGASGAVQTSTAQELTATFGPGGDWATLDETGDVHFSEGDRQATAAHARVVQATDAIMLDGSPVIRDATSETSAGTAEINQKTGEIRASGRVVSTEFGAKAVTAGKSAGGTSNKAGGAGISAISLGEGAAHITADALTGSTTSGEVTFQGHARLWQGQAVLSANRIEISKDQGNLLATGSVIGVFPQAGGQMPVPQMPSLPTKQSAPPANDKKAAQTPGGGSGVTLWQVRAPMLAYANADGKAHLEGGVTASSQQGSMRSETLDVFLQPPAIGGVATAQSKVGSALYGFTAQGGVTISQGNLQAKAAQAEYFAANEKFVMSGGEPTITDGSENTTTGRSLTFYTASDTILVDSEQGSRTLTKHRVEK